MNTGACVVMALCRDSSGIGALGSGVGFMHGLYAVLAYILFQGSVLMFC